MNRLVPYASKVTMNTIIARQEYIMFDKSSLHDFYTMSLPSVIERNVLLGSAVNGRDLSHFSYTKIHTINENKMLNTDRIAHLKGQCAG